MSNVGITVNFYILLKCTVNKEWPDFDETFLSWMKNKNVGQHIQASHGSHQVLVECEGRPPRCTLRTPPCCSPSPSAHTRCLSAADPRRRSSLSLHRDAATLWRRSRTWGPPTWLRRPLPVAGIPRRSAKPGPSPEAGASTRTAGRTRVSSECRWPELGGLWTETERTVGFLKVPRSTPTELLRGYTTWAKEPTANELQLVDEVNFFRCVQVKVSEGRISSEGETLEVSNSFSQPAGGRKAKETIEKLSNEM